MMEAFHPSLHLTKLSRINANNFELKSGLLSMVQQNQFSGIPINDLNVHLTQFLEICSNVKLNEVPDDAIRLHLFLLSLRDMAKLWYQILKVGADTTWEKVAHKFLLKYYPLGLTL